MNEGMKRLLVAFDRGAAANLVLGSAATQGVRDAHVPVTLVE